jgi:hypothetical protein
MLIPLNLATHGGGEPGKAGVPLGLLKTRQEFNCGKGGPQVVVEVGSKVLKLNGNIAHLSI